MKKKRKKQRKGPTGNAYNAHPQWGQLTLLAGTLLWQAGQTLKVWAVAGAAVVAAGAGLVSGTLEALGAGSLGSSSSNLDGLFGLLTAFTQIMAKMNTKIITSSPMSIG